MSSPAAAVPLAVLVLAWDETTPAARVLVEATELVAPPLDSVVALVPTGPPTNELSQEEFLPLEASPALPEPASTPSEPLPTLPVQASTTEAQADTTEAAASLLPDAASLATALPEPLAAPAAETQALPPPAAPLLLATELATATAAALAKPALVWQEVRVLRFGTNNPAARASQLGQGEPTFVWTGMHAVPAAPYLGSSAPGPPAQGGLGSANTTANSAVANGLLAATDTAASALVALRTLGPPTGGATRPGGEASAAPQTPAYLLAELPAAPDAESDATPAPTVGEPVASTETSATELSEAADNEPFTVDVTPMQTAALASTAPPATSAPLMAEPEFFAPVEAATSPELAGLRTAGRAFDAPNLNFQIIQYARMAVPRALNEEPFGVIYAPAWPTWLAAQELRHRSGQPLVLHIAKLAAADDEPIDLATGWVAELQRQALHRADLILTETAALAQRLRHELALPAHRVRPVPAADAAAVAQALRTAQRQ